MRLTGLSWFVVGVFASLAMVSAAAGSAATPTAQQALRLSPVQQGIDYDRPTPEEAGRCTIAGAKADGASGWIVKDSDGVILRRFLDTNDDNLVDRWSYFKEGLEVYRDIDADFNGKADEYRWFHTAGTRWGLDENEDGVIDSWKAISAEEVTAEVVAALAERDAARFARVALTPKELAALGLGETREKALAEKIADLPSQFVRAADGQQVVGPDAKWLQFSGNRPGIVPRGTDGSTQDLRVYENAMAIIESGGAHAQVLIGTMVDAPGGWRVIGVPQAVAEGGTELAGGFFFHGPGAVPPKGPETAGVPEQTQKLLSELEKIDAELAQATSPEAQATLNAKRADLVEQIAAHAGAKDRGMWLRQLADTVSAAVQAGTYPQGAARLQSLYESLKKRGDDKDLEAYVRFRQLVADYGLALQAKDADFAKVQAAWLKNLEEYVAAYPKSADTAEAMLQLAISQEFAGQEEAAQKWYGRIAAEFPESPAGRKAAGAQRRLDSVGKQIPFRGESMTGGLVDLAKYRGRVVLIQFWATWCEPCKTDMATLKEMIGKYGADGFSIIGVNLDNSEERGEQYVKENQVNWPQVHEEGGLDSRPANELGILTLPTMILVGPDGKVVNRNVHVAELDRELKRLIRK